MTFEDLRGQGSRRGYCQVAGCSNPVAGRPVIALREKNGKGGFITSRTMSMCEEHARAWWEKANNELESLGRQGFKD